MTKCQITLRLDPDIITHFKSDGRGWQSRINAVLRDHIEQHLCDATGE